MLLNPSSTALRRHSGTPAGARPCALPSLSRRPCARQAAAAPLTSEGPSASARPGSAVVGAGQRSVACAASTSGSGAPPAHSQRLQRVLDEIDAINKQDPRSVEVDGKQLPYEYAYSLWLTEWVEKLTADGNPPCSEELRIVARGQHVKRWVSPRNSYPEGRTAYLQWREDLKKLHAATVRGVMEGAGYPAASCDRVEKLILKRLLKEPEGQVAEDALCLVFLQRQFAEFRTKPDEGLMVDILRKTWKKMGDKGRAAALALPLGEAEAALVGKALSG